MPDVNEDKGADIFGANSEVNPPKIEDTKQDDKKYENIPEDHPIIVGLKNEIEKIKTEYGGNLSGQREKIKNLEKQIQDYKNGVGNTEEKGAIDPNLPYPEVKFSKDLSDKERELLTDNEIKMMDDLATMKKRENDKYLAELNKTKEVENKKVEDLQSLIKNTAIELSKDETGKERLDIANAIIESAKQFSYEGLSEEQIKERVGNGYKLLPTYTPPKEQINKIGSTITNNKAGENSFAENDKIIEEANKDSNGAYQL